MKKTLILAVFIINLHNIASSQCDFIDDIEITTLPTGFTADPGYTQEYALVDIANGLIEQVQSTPDFTGVHGGDFELYAINYTGTRPAEVAIGLTWSGTSAITGCFDTSMYPTTIKVCQELCEGDAFNSVVTTAPNTTGYTQTYVLVDASGNIVASNNTGLFDDTDYTNDGTFSVYAINTDDATSTTTITTAIQDGDPFTNVTTAMVGLCADILGPRYYQVNDKTLPPCCTADRTFIRD